MYLSFLFAENPRSCQFISKKSLQRTIACFYKRTSFSFGKFNICWDQFLEFYCKSISQKLFPHKLKQNISSYSFFFVFGNRQIVQKAIFSRNYVFPGVNHWPFPRKLGHCKKEQKYFEKIEIHYSLLALFRVDVLIRYSC